MTTLLVVLGICAAIGIFRFLVELWYEPAKRALREGWGMFLDLLLSLGVMVGLWVLLKWMEGKGD